MNWPNLDADRKAWELAKAALGPAAPLTELIARAQRIKEALQGRAA